MTVQILCLVVVLDNTTTAAQTSCKKVPDTQSIQITMFNSLSYLLLPTYLGKWENNCTYDLEYHWVRMSSLEEK